MGKKQKVKIGDHVLYHAHRGEKLGLVTGFGSDGVHLAVFSQGGSTVSGRRDVPQCSPKLTDEIGTYSPL